MNPPNFVPALVCNGVPATSWKGESTIPGIINDTCIAGYSLLRSVRKLAVRIFMAALAALYADRRVDHGTRARKDETFIR